LNIGATVGTGLNAEPEYVRMTIEILSKLMHFQLRKADYFPEVTQSSAGFLELSSSLRTLACDLLKITNDLRLMSSGPIAGFSEIVLPSLQPGSTIFPGKVNPVVPEAVQMVCYQVIGLDTAICLCAHSGQLELNATLPLIAIDLMHSLQIMTSATKILAEKSIHGIVANTERMRSLAERNPSIAMALNPHIGYEKSTAIVKRALSEGKTIKEVVLEMKVLPVDLVDRIFEPHELTEPGMPGKKKKKEQ
jgi:aspartate ammonia-lyase